MRFAAALAGLLALLSFGCADQGNRGPETAPVSGNVTLDGAPMQAGDVVFGVQGQPDVTIPVTNGAYSGAAPPGNAKVMVFSWRETPSTSGLSTDTTSRENIVAPQFNLNTTLSANVQKGAENKFNFDVKSK